MSTPSFQFFFEKRKLGFIDTNKDYVGLIRFTSLDSINVLVVPLLRATVPFV